MNMAKLVFIQFFLSAIIFSQEKRINIKDIFQSDGKFYINFSEDVASGIVYQFNDDLELPLGLIKEGLKQGKWLEWAGKNQKIKIGKSLSNDKDDSKKKEPIVGPSTLEIINYLSDFKHDKPFLKLISTQIINFDSFGSKMEESLKTYNDIGVLERKTYRKYEYFKRSNGLIEKIKIFNHNNILIQEQFFNYNKNKKLSEKKLFDIDADIIDKTTFSYDSLGMLEKKITLNKEGEKNNSITIEYDEQGKKNKELIQLYSSKTDTDYFIENNYSYDSNGKVVKKENQNYITYYHYNDFVLIKELTYMVRDESQNDKNIIFSKKIYNYY